MTKLSKFRMSSFKATNRYSNYLAIASLLILIFVAVADVLLVVFLKDHLAESVLIVAKLSSILTASITMLYARHSSHQVKEFKKLSKYLSYEDCEEVGNKYLYVERSLTTQSYIASIAVFLIIIGSIISAVLLPGGVADYLITAVPVTIALLITNVTQVSNALREDSDDASTLLTKLVKSKKRYSKGLDDKED